MHPVVTPNSIAAAVPQLQNSDAFVAVAQLFQSSQGQQVSRLSALGFLHQLHFKDKTLNTLGFFHNKKIRKES